MGFVEIFSKSVMKNAYSGTRLIRTPRGHAKGLSRKICQSEHKIRSYPSPCSFLSAVVIRRRSGTKMSLQETAIVPRVNLVPRVLWLFGQRVGASRDSGEFEKI